MKKKSLAIIDFVIASVVCCLILLLILPAVTGLWVKSAIVDFIAQQPSHLQLSLSEYDLGWFDSEFNLKFRNGKQNHFLTVKNQLIHGPICLRALHFTGNPFLKACLNSEVFIGKNKALPNAEFHINSMLNFNDDIDGFIGSKLLTHQQADNSFRFKLKPSTGNFRFRAASKKLKLNYHQPSLELFGNGNRVDISNIHLYTDFKQGAGGIQFGTLNIKIGKIVGHDKNKKNAHLNNFDLTFNATENNEFANYQLMLAAKQFSWGDQHYSDSEFDVILRNIKLDILQRLIEVQHRLTENKTTLIPANSIQMQLNKELILMMPDIIKYAELELSQLYLKSGEDLIDIWFRLSMSNVDEIMLHNPIFLLAAIDFEAELSLPAGLVEGLYEKYSMKSPRLISNAAVSQNHVRPDLEKNEKELSLANLQALVEQRYITLSGSQYLTSVHAKDGEYKINGQVIDPMNLNFP